MEHELRVSTDTHPEAVASAILKVYDEGTRAIAMVCVGPRPVTVAVKAVCALNRLLLGRNLEAVLRPRMFDREDVASGRTLTITSLRVLVMERV